MSRTRALRRRAGRIKFNDLRTRAILGAKVAGCRCRPELHVLRHSGDISHVRVEHDSWCPAVSAPSQYVAVVR